MLINSSAKWITPSRPLRNICPVFRKNIVLRDAVAHAELCITARGVYEAKLNGSRVGNFILAPGWTVYDKRLQMQRYDVTDLLSAETELCVTVGNGWYRSRIPGWHKKLKRTREIDHLTPDLIAALTVTYGDGTTEHFVTNESWQWSESPVRLATIYDGETYDAMVVPHYETVALSADQDCSTLIEQEGEIVCEHERLSPILLTTPNGERVLDFGQNLTGYVEFTVDAKAGDTVVLRCGEILSSDGNFYNSNYRTAKSSICYSCRAGRQTYKPSLSFFGFRYIKVEEFPGEVTPDAFTAIVLHSNIRRTGYLRCSEPLLNRLFDNIIWGQKDNYLDVPTDCPQRDERLGWTGDAQVFCRAASYNFDVKRFYAKWLHDLAADQGEDGKVGSVVPDVIYDWFASSAWGDAATIAPWQIYLTYGDPQILADQFESMCKWVDYIGSITHDKYLWTGCMHMGDWLSQDAPQGSCFGGSDRDLIASVYYIYSTTLVIKAGHVIGRDVSAYEELLPHLKAAFRERFTEIKTQTEHVLVLYFGLADEPSRIAENLARMIRRNGNRLQTGFVGTPYLLHALSRNGYADVAYSLLLQDEFPSWLYCVKQGATTIWERWDSRDVDGRILEGMNSFNHYAYGSVADWVYEVAAGIRTVEEHPGFAEVVIAPTPDRRLSWLEASIDTVHGVVSSKWTYVDGDRIRYEIKTPSPATIILGDETIRVEAGDYLFLR